MAETGASLRDIVHHRRRQIVDGLVTEVEHRHLAPAGLSHDDLADSIGKLVDQLCVALEAADARSVEQPARLHGRHRWETGFAVTSLVLEYGILRHLVVRAAAAAGRPLTVGQLLALDDAMQAALAASVGEYARFRDEQAATQVRELDEARAVLDTMLMAAPLGFGFIDRDMRFRLVNPRLAEMNGIDASKHAGRTPMELIPKLAPFVTKMHREVVESGIPRSAELVAETPAEPGVARTFNEHWYPVKVRGETIGAGVIVEEITHRKAAQAFRERIIGVVSHDLRNPVQAILTAANLMLLREGVPDDVRRLAGTVVRGASRMTGIIDQLFDYVRIEREGEVPLRCSSIDLAEVARRVVDESQLAFWGRAVDVGLRVRGDTTGRWDEARVAQVLTNLVRNAIQHGQGRAEVRVTGGETTVLVEVENRGNPIPADAVDHVFEPFRSSARTEGHLGLGLYIARQVVLAHGGAIRVRSDDRATVFSVELPRGVPSATTAPAPA